MMGENRFFGVTPYYNHHLAQGAEMYMKGAWNRPIRFSTPQAEVRATRQNIGLIDGHSMGKIRVIGKDARRFMQYAMANDLDRVDVGRGAIYSCLCDEKGGIIDDVIIYALEEQNYFLITNTLSGPKVDAWLRKLSAERGFDVFILNDTNTTAYLAIQGPSVPELLDRVFPLSYRDLNYFEFGYFDWENISVMVARTGFTGEVGFEFCFPSEYGHAVWGRLLELGADLGIQSVGGLAVQILRSEKSYRAYTLDMTQEDSPYEAGLGWSVRLDAADFHGRDALLRRKEAGVDRKLFGFEISGTLADVAQERTLVLPSGEEVGRITTICDSQTMGRVVAMAMIKKRGWDADQLLVGKTGISAFRTPMPFYDPKGILLKQDLRVSVAVSEIEKV